VRIRSADVFVAIGVDRDEAADAIFLALILPSETDSGCFLLLLLSLKPTHSLPVPLSLPATMLLRHIHQEFS
jgi:hypothetical protein